LDGTLAKGGKASCIKKRQPDGENLPTRASREHLKRAVPEVQSFDDALSEMRTEEEKERYEEMATIWRPGGDLKSKTPFRGAVGGNKNA